MQAITIILALILAVIGGYQLGKYETTKKLTDVIKAFGRELESQTAKLKEALTKGENHED